MRGAIVGLGIGLLLSGTIALAAVDTGSIRIPSGATATVQVGSNPPGGHTTVLRFVGIDFRCDYYRTQAPPPETRIEPVLLCGRSSNPASRGVVITPYRIYVTSAAGNLVYRATRTP